MERTAYICTHKECDPPRRVFVVEGEPVPRCGLHGKMQRQTNVPYERHGKDWKPGTVKRRVPRRPSRRAAV